MNTNPQAKRILCFGDSNTWGYIPGTKHQRYPANIRWTGVLQDALGLDYEVIEEGLNSRGIVKGDGRPGKEQRSAMEYILACLDTHDPLDYVIVCLGANELKAEFQLSAEEVGDNMSTLVDMICSRPSQFREQSPEVILVVPAAIDEPTDYAQKDGKFVGAYAKSLQLADVLSNVAQAHECRMLDIQQYLKTGEDGVHLLPESHRLLGEKLASFSTK